MWSHARLRQPFEDYEANTFKSEVDRAIDNLVKSGKMFNVPGRRDSMPLAGGAPRAFPEQFGKFNHQHQTCQGSL